jgi:hypothetical protein
MGLIFGKVIKGDPQKRTRLREKYAWTGVETHPYSPFLGYGDHFWQSYEENQVQKISCRDLPYDFEKKRNRHLYQDSHFAKRTVGCRQLPIAS